MAGELGAGAAGATMLQEILREKFAQALALQQQKRIAEAQRQQAAYQQESLGLQRRSADRADESARVLNEQRQSATQQETAARETAGHQNRLKASIVGSQNLAGSGDPQGALATRNALRVALTSSGADAKAIPQEPEPVKPKLRAVTVPGPNGQPIHKLVPEDQLQQGVPAYRAPQQARDERLVQVQGPNGQPIWVRESEAVGKPAMQAPRAVTGAERGVLAYYNRAKDASDTLETPDKSGTSLEDRVAKAGLASQLGLQYAPNMLQSSDQQAYRQAQRAFTEARLRKESGAAIPTSEYENDAKTYFAQPGDKPEVIEQKRRKRQTVLEGLKFSSGRAYQEFYGDDTAAPSKGAGGGGRVYYDANGNPIKR